MIKALHSPGFQKDDVAYGFFGRQGGVSKGIYKSLNCRGGSDDDPKDVAENRKRVADKIGVDGDQNTWAGAGDFDGGLCASVVHGA